MHEGSHKREPFDASGEFVTRKPFLYGDKSYGEGELFDSAGIEKHRLANLWSARFIDVTATPSPEHKGFRRKRRKR